MKKVLIYQGGWDGHEPKQTSARFGRLMEEEGYAVEIFDSLDCLADYEKLLEYHLIVGCWTMGSIDPQYSNARSGPALAWRAAKADCVTHSVRIPNGSS